MADGTQADLGEVQQTLFFPLLARARETVRRRPLLRDPIAVEILHAVHFNAATCQQGPFGFAVVIRRLGLRLVETATPTRPPAGLQARLPARYRCLVLPVARALTGHGPALSRFQAGPVLPGETRPREGS